MGITVTVDPTSVIVYWLSNDASPGKVRLCGEMAMHYGTVATLSIRIWGSHGMHGGYVSPYICSRPMFLHGLSHEKVRRCGETSIVSAMVVIFSIRTWGSHGCACEEISHGSCGSLYICSRLLFLERFIA